MSFCLDAVWSIELEFGTCFAEFGAELSGCEDGNGEDLGGCEQFLGRGDYFCEFVDCWAEFLLEVADAGVLSVDPAAEHIYRHGIGIVQEGGPHWETVSMDTLVRPRKQDIRRRRAGAAIMDDYDRVYYRYLFRTTA